MEALRTYLAQIADLEQARRILGWDQQTYSRQVEPRRVPSSWEP